MEAFYLPIAHLLEAKISQQQDTFFLAINGCQGSGKSTLSEFLAEYFHANTNISVAILSLDDFYFSRQERNGLAVKISPLLATRGVPGTHDTNLLAQVLTDLNRGVKNLALPRFDKSTDDPFPKSEWPILKHKVDLVIMEGWCWGVKSQTTSALREPVNKLEKDQDPLATWRHYVNQALLNEYEPLYSQMDYWIMLKAPSFDNVFNWRLEQEQKLAQKVAGQTGKKVMSEQEVYNFIQYYQRLTEQALMTLPQRCDIVLALDENRHLSLEKGELNA